MRERIEEAVAGMRAAGHAPSEALWVRLTDGRLRMLPADDPQARLQRLENEQGPIGEAYRVTADGEVVPLEARAARGDHRDSSSWAILAASLGMTTGALPKAGSSLVPSGAVKSPVW